MKTVIITGGTGLIGRSLIRLLREKGYKVMVFTRRIDISSSDPDVIYLNWDPEAGAYDRSAINEADYMINLAGAGIAEKRWTKEWMKTLYISRINSAETIVNAVKENPLKLKAVISASAIGYYGKSDGRKILVEEDPPGKSFLSGLCKDWEEKIRPVADMGKRLVILRTGVVLDPQGGAYPKMTAPLKFHVKPLTGSGNQVMSWIHIHDLCNIYLSAVENEKMNGIYNACAPATVSSKIFMTEAGRIKGLSKLLTIHAPIFMLRLILGKVTDEALLQNANVNCEKLLQTGFRFQYPTVSDALTQLEEKSR